MVRNNPLDNRASCNVERTFQLFVDTHFHWNFIWIGFLLKVVQKPKSLFNLIIRLVIVEKPINLDKKNTFTKSLYSATVPLTTNEMLKVVIYNIGS